MIMYRVRGGIHYLKYIPNLSNNKHYLTKHLNKRPRLKGNAPNDPKLNLNTEQSKLLYIHWIFTPEAQILARFAPRQAISEIQGHKKSEMDRMTKPNLNT